MGFVLSILYLITYYLTPPTIFGPLAEFRVELILAVLVFLVSLHKLMGAFVWKTPQSLALGGLSVAIFFSVLVGMRWPGGAIQASFLFIPNAFAYLLVCLHCDSLKKLKALVLMMLFVCLFVTAQGFTALQRGLPVFNPLDADDAVALQDRETDPSPYLLGMSNDAKEWIYRVRGLGEINDPNDFAQLIVCVIPLVFIFWKKKRNIRNILVVLLPVSTLLFGAYLTHSRGATLALLAMVIVAVRPRIGTIPSLLIAVGLFIGASALHVTGGRDISASAGEDRTDLWGQGLELLKSHPLFGVGFDQMPDYVGKTAHNSLVVCAAELGMFGLFFWVLFLFPTVRDALAIASPSKVSEGEAVIPEKTPYPQAITTIEVFDKAEVNRLGRLIVLSFTGFLVAAWFLSRSFVVTLFLLGGIAEVVFQMALQRGMISPRLPAGRVLRYTGVTAVALVMLMYVLLRVVNLTH